MNINVDMPGLYECVVLFQWQQQLHSISVAAATSQLCEGHLHIVMHDASRAAEVTFLNLLLCKSLSVEFAEFHIC